MTRNSGIEPTVVEYLKTPPSTEQIRQLLSAMDASVRDKQNKKGTPFAELDLDNREWSDERLLALIEQHPILLNRPIVVTPMGVRLCRPSEVVLDILPFPQQGPFIKEDGEIVIDTTGRKVGSPSP